VLVTLVVVTMGESLLSAICKISVHLGIFSIGCSPDSIKNLSNMAARNNPLN